MVSYNIRNNIKVTKLNFLENQSMTNLKGSPVPPVLQSLIELSCKLNVLQEEFEAHVHGLKEKKKMESNFLQNDQSSHFGWHLKNIKF